MIFYCDSGRDARMEAACMYYDRTIPDELLNLVKLDGSLHWVVDLVNSPWGVERNAHIQFRRDAKNQPLGSVHVYLGRTAILKIEGRAKGRVGFHAADSYQEIYASLQRWPLFRGTFSAAELAGLKDELNGYLCDVGAQARQEFVGGEGASHGGLMRRYGSGYQPGDPLLAVDSEVRCGFDSIKERTDSRSLLAAELGVGSPKGLPTKLDTIGVLRDGSIGVIEVKDQKGDMRRAIVQAAAHVGTLGKTERKYLVNGLHGLMAQKVASGLLPQSIEIQADAELVPIIAAPDTREKWFEIWRDATVSVRKKHAAQLAGLRFWLLSESGELVEEMIP
jgi:hypothetical protein